VKVTAFVSKITETDPNPDVNGFFRTEVAAYDRLLDCRAGGNGVSGAWKHNHGAITQALYEFTAVLSGHALDDRIMVAPQSVCRIITNSRPLCRRSDEVGEYHRPHPRT
jgi:hypothetical protein